MLLIDAIVIDRFANTGEIASTNARPDNGLAFLGTIIEDPGKI